MKIGMFRFGDGKLYKKKGDRCSCKYHDPRNSLPACKKCDGKPWPGECAIENYQSKN
jgi:hypothetical protein